jgi:hypothetical protein
VWEDDHLFFADICSPQTIANLLARSLIEVNVVDPFVHKGYRFKGRTVICEPGPTEFTEGTERLRAGDSKLTGRIKTIVVIEVQHAQHCSWPRATHSGLPSQYGIVPNLLVSGCGCYAPGDVLDH